MSLGFMQASMKWSRARVTIGGQCVLLQNYLKIKMFFLKPKSPYESHLSRYTSEPLKVFFFLIIENRPQSSKNAQKWITICKIHDVDKSTVVLVFNSFLVFYPWASHRKHEKVEKKLFLKCGLRNLKTILYLAINLLWKSKFFKAKFSLVLHWCLVFNTFLCSIFGLSTGNIKQNWNKTVMKMWSQNIKNKCKIWP